MTLFDPSPKSSPKDLFGREKELQDLVNHLEARKWVVLLGPRRIGKTSLARCALAKLTKASHAIVDAREESDFAKALFVSLSKSSHLSSIKVGAGMGPISASIAVTRDFVQTSLSRLLNSVKKTILLVDEAQWLRNPKGVSRILAHMYDYHYDRITLVITGSAVGVMRSILEPTSKSPFYGRALTKMEIERWEQSTSLRFLKAGCKEERLGFEQTRLSGIVEQLDGIPGWLTLYGYNYSARPGEYEVALRKTTTEARKILKDELESVSRFSLGWQRQMKILKELSSGPKTFTEIGTKLGINDTALSNNLNMLERLRYISKNNGTYSILDPMVMEYAGE